MSFDLQAYGPGISGILAISGSGERLMPLVAGAPCEVARGPVSQLASVDTLSGAAHPQAALAGIWTYFSFFDEAHRIAQDIPTAEGSFWHAILHRQEPDAANAAYWFRQVGRHPIFPELAGKARDVLARRPEAVFRPTQNWDPIGFIAFCEAARARPGSPDELAALEIQRAEWQLLFSHCARPRE